MPDYRAFIVSPDGHFDRFVPIDCADDDAAIEQARQLVDGHDVELWHRDRLVVHLKRRQD